MLGFAFVYLFIGFLMVAFASSLQKNDDNYDATIFLFFFWPAFVLYLIIDGGYKLGRRMRGKE